MEALLANLPLVLLFLLCPLMMLFMHRGGTHDGHGADHAQHHADNGGEPTRNISAAKDEAKT